MREHGEWFVDDDVCRGACASFQTHDLGPAERIPIFRTDFDAHATTPALRRWLQRHRPEAVVATLATDLQWIEGAGLRVPRDVAFASLHVGGIHRGRVAGSLGREAVVGQAISPSALDASSL